MKNWWNGISEVRSALSFFHIEMEPHWTANKVLGILTGHGEMAWILKSAIRHLFAYFYHVSSCLWPYFQLTLPSELLTDMGWAVKAVTYHYCHAPCSILFMLFCDFQTIACLCVKIILFMHLRWGTRNPQLLPDVMWLWGALLLHVVPRTRGAPGITPVPLKGEIRRGLTHFKAREAQIKC